SVLPAGAFIASGEIPSGGITTVGSTLLRTSPTCGVKSKSAVVPKICARFSTRFTPRNRDLLCHLLQRPVDLLQDILASFLNDPVPLTEFAPRFGDAVLQLPLFVADLLWR